jgi:hypothetical protein
MLLSGHGVFITWQFTHICEEFSRCTGGQIETGTVEVRVLFSQNLGIFDFEDFVQSELEETLKTITND